MTRFPRVQLAASLLLMIACGVLEPKSTPATKSSEVGAANLSAPVRHVIDRADAVKAWRERGDHSAALSLSRAYFPEFSPWLSSVGDAAKALTVVLPERAGGVSQISTRGYTFTVSRLLQGDAAAAAHDEEATFFGRAQLWALAGRGQKMGARLVADRIEEFEIVDAEGLYASTYRIELPAGISGVRDTGEYLEFSDGTGGAPVLRMHYPEVRDVEGHARTGKLSLRGVRAVAEAPGVFVASSGVLYADLSVELSGLVPPLVVDPGFSSTGSMASARRGHTATLMGNGKVLIAGGRGSSGNSWMLTAEVYDPATGTFASTANGMSVTHGLHTATLLKDGRVFIAGGAVSTGVTSATELYDPATNAFTTGPTLGAARQNHTATLLRDGRVYIVGGATSSSLVGATELFDPSSNQLSSGQPLINARHKHAAVLLANNKVLIIGGHNTATGNSTTSSVELHDPATATNLNNGNLTNPRGDPTATLMADGFVLVTGGTNSGTPMANTEISNLQGSSWIGVGGMTDSRVGHTATLLPNGNVMIVGGASSSGPTQTTDVYGGSWLASDQLVSLRSEHTTTLLPNGQLLIVGGTDGTAALSSTELYTPAGTARFKSTAGMSTFHGSATATLLTNGKVLVAGGTDNTGTAITTSELYDAFTKGWTATGPMTTARQLHTATLLNNGKVLIAGGTTGSGAIASAELYDRATGVFTATGSMTTGRYGHAAVLLPNGKVLVVGGGGATGWHDTTEIYDPTTGTWTAGPTMAAKRSRPGVVLLFNGKVLVSGGYTGIAPTPTSELFDPATGQFTATGLMQTARSQHTASLLPTGIVVAVGGSGTSGALNSVELYNPATGQWTNATATLTTARSNPTATTLPSGRVLIAGGFGTGTAPAEIFDGRTGTFTATGAPGVEHGAGTAVLLQTGMALIAGGQLTSSAELFAETDGQITSVPSCLGPAQIVGRTAAITGTGFRGVSTASDGRSNDSASDVPMVRLQSMQNGRVIALTTTGFVADGTGVNVGGIPAGAPFGYYLAWVSTNAVTGTACILTVQANSAPTADSKTATVQEDLGTGVNVTATGADPDADPLTFAVVTQPANGTVTGGPTVFNYKPNLNFAGTDSFTYKANDGSLDSPPATVTITVTAANDQPVMDAVSNVGVLEDAAPFTVTVTGVGPGGGADEAGQTVSLTATSGNTALIASPTVSGSGASRTLSFASPAANATGNATITVTANDGAGGTATQTFQVIVNAVNDPPTLNAIADVTGVAEDASSQIVTLAGVGAGGSGEGGQVLLFTLTSSDPSIVPNPSISLIGGVYRLNFAPAPNASGTVTITVTLKDDGGTANGGSDTTIRNFKITVDPVNDPPTVVAANATALEDTAKSVTVTGVTAGGGTFESAQTVTVTATSSNTALIGHPTVSGTGSTRTLSFPAPAANAIGMVTVTVTATDDGGTANGGVDTFTTTFTLDVQAVNDAPVVDAISAVTVNEEAGQQTVTLTGVGPGGGSDEAGQTVMVSAGSTDINIVPNPTITGTGSTRTLTFTPAANGAGTVTITVLVSDNGGTANGGVGTSTRTFTITVTPINDAPVLSTIADATALEDQPFTVTVASVSAGGGSDEASQTLTLTATSSNTALLANPTVSGTGGSRTLNFAAPATHASGTSTITVTLTDSGGTANGGVDTATRTFVVTVSPVNDAPSFDALADVTIAEDSAAQMVNVTGLIPGGGADEAAQTITLTSTSSVPALIPNPVVSGTGATRVLTFTPAPGMNGATTITVTATDSGGTANSGVNTFSRTFLVTVTPANDPPTFDAISDVTSLEDSTPSNVTITGVDPGAPDESSQTVTVTATSSDMALLPNPTVTGTGANRTLSFGAPAANAVGTVTITVTATDNSGASNASFSRTFTVTLTPVNDRPSLDAISNVTPLEDTPTDITLTGVVAGGGADEATQTITVTATSANPAIIANVTVTGTGATRTLSFTPVANRTGTVTITVTATDDGGTANGGVETSLTRSFNVTIGPVNDAPYFDAVPNQSVLKDSGTRSINLTSVSAGGGPDEETQTLTITATSSNPAVIPNPLITGSGQFRTLTYAPAAGQRGAVTITVEAKDSGGTANGGADTYTQTFDIAVTAGFNSAPIAEPGSVTSDGSPVAITLRGNDVDLDAIVYTVLTQPTHGELSGDAPNLTYTPTPGYSGLDSFTFKVSDGTLDSQPAVFSITVNGQSTEGAGTQSHYGWSCGCSTGVDPMGFLALFLGAGLLRSRRRREETGAGSSWLRVLMIAALVVLPATAQAESGKRMKLAFLGITASSGVSSDTASSVSGYVQSQLISFDAYDVTGVDEIKTMIGLERQKELLGCSDATQSCLAEIGGALNAERAISGDVSRIGDTTLLNLTLIDLKASKAISRVAKRVQGGDSVEALLDTSGPALYELLSSDPGLEKEQLKFERGFGGLLVGTRGEVDVAGKSVAPAVTAELTGKRLGGALTVLIGPTPGFRGEARFYPVELGRVRPYLGAGATVFAPAVGLRGAAGVEVRIGQVHVFGDAAFERFVNDAVAYAPNAFLVGAGVGWLF